MHRHTADSDVPPIYTDGGFGASSQTGQETHHWSNIFPFGAPYPNQKQGIKSTLENGRKNGYSLIEGACGTGKTLMALTTGISLVRDPDTEFERVLVITPVKQQQQAFVEDLKSINDAARDDLIPISPVSGVTIVGKADICPYVESGNIESGDIYDDCTKLRKNTRSMMEEQAGDPVDNAMDLIDIAERDMDKPIEYDGNDSPFGQTPVPGIEDRFCPFYAQYRADDITDQHSILSKGRVLDRERLMQEAINYGSCPHTIMRDSMLNSEVVIGNYNHVFSPLTVETFSNPLIDDKTYLVIDEAHQLVEEVRDHLSFQTSHTAVDRAASRCRDVANWLSQSSSSRGNLANSVFKKYETLEPEDVTAFGEFLEYLGDEIEDIILDKIEHAHPGCNPPYYDLGDFDIPLRDPESSSVDTITEMAHLEGYSCEVWEKAEDVGEAVSEIIGAINREIRDKTGNGAKYAKGVGNLLSDWAESNHTEYYREIRLVDRGFRSTDFDKQWKQTHKAELWLNNCIPGDRIASRLDDFGGGVIMSATLAPISVYKQNIGLNYLTDRPSNEEIFGLTFPEGNRCSLAVDVDAFTYSNRFSTNPEYQPDDQEKLDRMHNTRETYLSAMADVVRNTPGNILIGTPSYAEATWAADGLRERGITKEILLDQPSSNEDTTKLKEEFFAGPPKTLVTGLRGTLTEGVDYPGDQLSAVVCVGLPIVNTMSDRMAAIETAYDENFSGPGFRYAFSIPALRKTRQGLGRVIRGADDVGIRILLDERYTSTSQHKNKVRRYFPDTAASEFRSIQPDELSTEIQSFWRGR